MDNASVCRSCGETRLTPILALGAMPLAHRLLTADQLDAREPSYPLAVVLCPKCALLQITDTVPQGELPCDVLDYVPLVSESVMHQAQELSAQILASQKLRPTSLVIDLGSQDGHRLRPYQQAGIPVLGIEPSVHAAEAARHDHGVPTLCKFFNRDLALNLAACGQQADVVHVHNVLPHVRDLHGFLAALGDVLKPSGVAVFEVPYVKDLVDNVEFDTIYHEHRCYFSLTSLAPLLDRHGLVVHDVEHVAMLGGMLRLFVGKSGEVSHRVQNLLAEEAAWGVDRATYYLGLCQRIEQLRNELMALLRRLKAEGRKIAVYGASAKGSTLLNYFKIGRDMVDFVVDRNTFKQGRYTPGTHLKIHSPDKLMQDKPDYVLLLSWNMADEILAQQAGYRKRGGQFIIPIPKVKVA
jgi:SAM-dependent methyltransferase